MLIDAGWAETFDTLLDNIRKIGFDPDNIWYFPINHWRRTTTEGPVESKSCFVLCGLERRVKTGSC